LRLPLTRHRAQLKQRGGPALARAQGLFHDGQFQASIDVLLDLDKRISNDPENAANKRKSICTSDCLFRTEPDGSSEGQGSFKSVRPMKYSLNADLLFVKIIAVFGQAKQACAEDRAAKAPTSTDAVVQKHARRRTGALR
jgi:hypothetical protein